MKAKEELLKEEGDKRRPVKDKAEPGTISCMHENVPTKPLFSILTER